MSDVKLYFDLGRIGPVSARSAKGAFLAVRTGFRGASLGPQTVNLPSRPEQQGLRLPLLGISDVTLHWQYGRLFDLQARQPILEKPNISNSALEICKNQRVNNVSQRYDGSFVAGRQILRKDEIVDNLSKP